MRSVFSLSDDRSTALLRRVLHRVQACASSFSVQCPLFSIRPSGSCLCLLLRLPVTNILPSIFPSMTRCRIQFLRKIRPIQLTFLLFIVCRIFLPSLTLCNTSSFLTWLFQLMCICSLLNYCVMFMVYVKFANVAAGRKTQAVRFRVGHPWCKVTQNRL